MYVDATKLWFKQAGVQMPCTFNAINFEPNLDNDKSDGSGSFQAEPHSSLETL